MHKRQAKGRHTSINLPNLRQRQTDLIPIHDGILRLQRIALEIHRVQLLLVGQLPLHLLERLELVVGGPQFLELAEVLQVGEVRDLVVGDVEDAQVAVVLEAGDGGQGVVRDVEFFEVGEGVEAGDGGEPVGLDGEDFEVREGGDVLGWMFSFWGLVHLGWSGVVMRTLSWVILFLPSQSSSRLVRVSRFSISCSPGEHDEAFHSFDGSSRWECTHPYPVRSQLQIPQLP